MRAAGRFVLDTFALVLIAAALVMLSGRLVVQPVLSGSMTGYAARGDLVVGMPTPSESLHVGDVILFAPPAPYGTPDGRPVAHRIHSIEIVDGLPVATTKGDANAQPDPWRLDLTRTRTAEVRLVVPNAGWPFIRRQALATPGGRMATGLVMMAAGGGILLVGRRRARRSDEPWPPAFEGAALEARLAVLAQRREDDRPVSMVSRYGPAPVFRAEGAPLIPRQVRRIPAAWSPEEALAHSPVE